MIKLKVWWVVAYDYQYPDGGLGNVKGCFYTKKKALEVAEGYNTRFDVVNVIDVSRFIALDLLEDMTDD